MSLYVLLPLAFAFMVFFVGGYVFMMLGIMRADQNAVESRKKQGYNDDIVPKKIVVDKEEKKTTEV
ncbi:MAG: Unknown protein [uncultured Sulfurovum sp.]|uniref:Uncharacterized protein n=1 Tax=uncultured Sulfurovum sp. TaxID=269237 RepID=A0A6S6S344_9BACT|nr:MAG: Unknown protein [uncultured Sulfurovum sp.]